MMTKKVIVKKTRLLHGVRNDILKKLFWTEMSSHK